MAIGSEKIVEETQDPDVILQIDHISKAFPGVLALNDVSIDVKRGEILAILGENGAGKSTLMKILSGLYQPDRGQILVNKEWFKSPSEKSSEEGILEPLSLSEPRQAIELGIGQVYQHFQLVGPFTVGENITLGKEFTGHSHLLIDYQKTNETIQELSKNFGLPIDPSVKVEDLPIGLKQRTEILKQLYRKAELLILDEPTAVLTPTEVDELFKTIQKLRDAGKSIIFISHKLKESLRIADRIVVLRKGQVVGETKPQEVNERQLAEMLVGRKLLKQLDRKELPLGPSILEVTNLSLTEGEDAENQKRLLDDINFTVYGNQIVGVVGVQGNGQSELLDCLVGMRTPTSGSILFTPNGRDHELTNMNTLQILSSGIGYIPEDRTLQGLILDFNLSENTWLGFHGFIDEQYDVDAWPLSEDGTPNQVDRNLIQKLLLPVEVMKNLASDIVKDYDVKTPSIGTRLASLSGGNQQKVLIGREFAKNPHLIIAAEPTRGVDIGVMEKVHKELIRRRDEGVGILLVSSDLDETLKLADYLLIMYEGKIVGSGNIQDLSIQEISELMTFGERKEELQ